MTRLLLMTAALAVIILVRFLSDMAAIKRLSQRSGLSRLQARAMFRAEIYNTMAANKITALAFLAALGYGIWLFLHTTGPDRVLMPILTIILAMEFGRYLTRKEADAHIEQRLAQRQSATTESMPNE